MSRREKTTNIFSRNGVKIIKTEYIKVKQPPILSIHTVSTNTGVKSKVEVIPAKKAWDEIIKRESKLGFYYYETVHHEATQQKTVYNSNNGFAKYKKYVIEFDDKRYELSYPIECGDNKISKELRPWEILPNTKGMEQHFINDLYDEVLKFVDVAVNNRCAVFKGKHYDHSNYNWVYTYDKLDYKRIIKDICIDLFGDENGPTIVYNDIKILSHGFDLKESFRKRKES